MATANQPCVVFLDEIDSIAPERDGDLHQARAEAVNKLLQHVAAINEEDADVVVIAATNRPDRVDDALKRTGRFDTRIKIGMPDGMTRLAILEHELQAFEGPTDPVWTDAEFIDTFVEATANFASSDVVEVVEAAGRASVRETNYDKPPRITQDILLEQLSDVDEKQQADTAGEFLTETPEIDFDDVGGMAETKSRLEETLLDPLDKPDLYEAYGLEISNGVLLYGPPGTGKTYLSRALAGEAGCSFLPITASDIVSKWVGEAAENIQELFEKAENVAPAIVFIDEIDAIAGSRGGTKMSNTEEQAVNELLAQISGLDEQDVFVIGTTNRLDIIDDALTRAGRLGETVEVPPPDAEARIEILQKQLDGRPVDSDTIMWDDLSLASESEAETQPYVAADIAKIADEAARLAMAEAGPNDIQPVTQAHLEEAIDTVDPSVPTDTEEFTSLT
jgi:SpoVK/Ycf46/Vps4 family AAA+-type ATPase